MENHWNNLKYFIEGHPIIIIISIAVSCFAMGWEITAIIGQKNGDSNRKFDIAVVKVGEKGSENFNSYFKNGYPEQNLPEDAVQLGEKITVIRK